MWTLGPGTSTSGVLNYTSDSLIDNIDNLNTTFTAATANTTAAAALELESEAVNVTQPVVITTESTEGVAGVQVRDTSSLLNLASSAYYSSALDQAGLWGSSAVFSPAYQQQSSEGQ